MRRRPRLTSASLEELLDGGRVTDSGLSRVLSAARAPAVPEELAGLDVARTAFDRTSHASSRRPVSSVPAATRTAAGRLLALKAIAAVSGATLIGGVAYAATGTELLGGGSPHHGPSQHAPGSAPASTPWNLGTVPSGSQSSVAGGRPVDRPSRRRATPSNSHGSSAAASVRASHPSAPSTTWQAPSRTATTPAPSGHAKTTPPTVPSDRPTPTATPSRQQP